MQRGWRRRKTTSLSLTIAYSSTDKCLLWRDSCLEIHNYIEGDPLYFCKWQLKMSPHRWICASALGIAGHKCGKHVPSVGLKPSQFTSSSESDSYNLYYNDANSTLLIRFCAASISCLLWVWKHSRDGQDKYSFRSCSLLKISQRTQRETFFCFLKTT